MPRGKRSASITKGAASPRRSKRLRGQAPPPESMNTPTETNRQVNGGVGDTAPARPSRTTTTSVTTTDASTVDNESRRRLALDDALPDEADGWADLTGAVDETVAESVAGDTQQPAVRPGFNALPDEVIVLIFQHVGSFPSRALMRLAEVCKRWHSIVNSDPSMRKHVDLTGPAAKYPVHRLTHTLYAGMSKEIRTLILNNYRPEPTAKDNYVSVHDVIASVESKYKLDKVSLADTGAFDADLEILLECNPCIDHLDLTRCEFLTAKGLKHALFRADDIRHTVVIKTLDMTGCFGSWSSVLTPGHVIDMVDRLGTVESLILAESPGISRTSVIAQSRNRLYPKLKHLGLSKCMTLDIVTFSELVAKFPALESVDLSYVPKVSLQVLQRQCKNLKVLNLARSSGLRIVRAIEETYHTQSFFPHLTELDLSGQRDLTDRQLTYIGTHSPFITKLNISECKGVKWETCRSSFNNLEELDISYCWGISGPQLAKYAAQWPPLRKLVAVGYRMNVDDGVCHAIAENLPRLQYLDLSANRNVTSNAIKDIIECTSIKTLILSVCPKVNFDAMMPVRSLPVRLEELHVQEMEQCTQGSARLWMHVAPLLKMIVMYGCHDWGNSEYKLFKEHFPGVRLLIDRDLNKRVYPVQAPGIGTSSYS